MFIQGEASSTLPKTREGGRGQTKHQPRATAQGNPGGMQLQTIQTCSPPVTFRAIAHRSASSTQKGNRKITRMQQVNQESPKSFTSSKQES